MKNNDALFIEMEGVLTIYRNKKLSFTTYL
jgi:hypothetical protein